MGVSTDAIFVYGFEIDEEDDEGKERCQLLMDETYDVLVDAEKRLGAQLVYHCSDECTEYIVGLEKTYMKAWRGYPQTINVTKMALFNHAEMDAELRAIAEALGLEAKPGKWLLCSYWG